MEIIDNVNRLLGDDLRETIAPGSKLRIAASTFSIFAFEALMDELRDIDELQFVFTSPTFVNGESTDRLRKEKRRYFIPATPPEANLAGTEFEIRLRNKLTQKAIARECASWIREKVRFKTNATSGAMQTVALIDNAVAYTPLQGFTTPSRPTARGKDDHGNARTANRRGSSRNRPRPGRGPSRAGQAASCARLHPAG